MTDPEVLFGVSRRRPAVRAPSPEPEPPLVGSARPSEFSPTRVAGYWLPAPPMSSARMHAGLRGVSRSGHPRLRRATGPLLGLGTPFRVSNRPFRPSRSRNGSSLEVRSPTTTTLADPAHPGLPHPAPSGLRVSTLSPVCSLRTIPVLGPVPPMGFTLQGLLSSTSRARYRTLALLPFPVLPAFSSEDEKVGSSAATPELCSGRRAVPFREVEPPFRATPCVGLLPSEALVPPR